jgi:hypothetical protein
MDAELVNPLSTPGVLWSDPDGSRCLYPTPFQAATFPGRRKRDLFLGQPKLFYGSRTGSKGTEEFPNSLDDRLWQT